MEAKELRIGNYCEYNIIDENQDEWIFNEVEISDLGDTSYLRPIPLTEEWLFKFGFEVRDVDFYILHIPNKFKVYISISVEHDSYQLCQNGTGYTVDIKHVHQLQNLYFVLTGKELEE